MLSPPHLAEPWGFGVPTTMRFSVPTTIMFDVPTMIKSNVPTMILCWRTGLHYSTGARIHPPQHTDATAPSKPPQIINNLEKKEQSGWTILARDGTVISAAWIICGWNPPSIK